MSMHQVEGAVLLPLQVYDTGRRPHRSSCPSQLSFPWAIAKQPRLYTHVHIDIR